jgi:hypothetical protein
MYFLLVPNVMDYQVAAGMFVFENNAACRAV